MYTISTSTKFESSYSHVYVCVTLNSLKNLECDIMCENNSTNKSIRTVEMLPITVEGREMILRVVKDNNGRIYKANLCIKCGDLAMIIEGDY